MKRQRPNFLFFFSDQHRGDWMPYCPQTMQDLGVEQLRLNMPNIRHLMDRGTAFTCAISPAPVCAPARACLASGKRYRNCRVYQNNVNYDPALPSFYGLLKDAGYHVTGLGKFDLNKGDLDWGGGFHETLQRMGFSDARDSEGKMDTVWAAMVGEPGPYGRMLKEHGVLELYQEDMISRGRRDIPTPLPEEYYADNWIGENCREMLRELPNDRPWFLQVNFSGPHDPWDVTEEMKRQMHGRSFPNAADCTFSEANQGVRQNYAAMIENIDRQIGLCLETLQELDMAENTVIVYAADHGEMMGDHSCYGKSKPWQGSIHIPLVIDASRFGGVRAEENRTPVELQDLAATFLELAGAAPLKHQESCSLVPILRGNQPRVRDFAVSELITRTAGAPIDSFTAVTDGTWKLIMQPGRENRLFNLASDPFECRDLANIRPDIVQRLRRDFSAPRGAPNPAFARYKKSFDF